MKTGQPKRQKTLELSDREYGSLLDGVAKMTRLVKAAVKTETAGAKGRHKVNVERVREHVSKMNGMVDVLEAKPERTRNRRRRQISD